MFKYDVVKMYWGSGGKLQILNLAAFYVIWQLNELVVLPLGKSSPVLIGSQSRSGPFADRTTLLLSLITD